MKFIVFLVCLTLIGFLEQAISQECVTPTQVAGTCINVKDCQPMVELLQREGTRAREFAKRFLCRNDDKNIFVCCPGKPGTKMRENLYGPLLPPRCGFSNVSHTRIVGGVPAKLNAWPWLAALGFNNTRNSEIAWRCGGTLISARHVLTAAHCAERQELSVVRLGDLNLIRDDDGAHPITVGIEKKIIHPKYGMKRINDIAVVKLDRDVQFTDNIHPICLPVGRIRHLNFVHSRPFLAGWGTLYSGGPTSADLMEIQAPVISTETCIKAHKGSRINDESFLCTDVVDGRDACRGDSGGPVMLPINGSFYQIGVIMGGRTCAESSYPGVSSRVTTYLRFIVSSLQ